MENRVAGYDHRFSATDVGGAGYFVVSRSEQVSGVGGPIVSAAWSGISGSKRHLLIIELDIRVIRGMAGLNPRLSRVPASISDRAAGGGNRPARPGDDGSEDMGRVNVDGVRRFQVGQCDSPRFALGRVLVVVTRTLRAT